MISGNEILNKFETKSKHSEEELPIVRDKETEREAIIIANIAEAR